MFSVAERYGVLVPSHLKGEDEIRKYLTEFRTNMLTLREANRRKNAGNALSWQVEAVVDGTFEAAIAARELRKQREDLEQQLRVLREDDEEAEQRRLSGNETLLDLLRQTVARQVPKLAAFESGASEGRDLVAAANRAWSAANEAGRVAERLADRARRSEAMQRKRDEEDMTRALNTRQLDNPIDVDTFFGADQGKHPSSSAAKRASKFARLHQVATAQTPPVLQQLPVNPSKKQRRAHNQKKRIFQTAQPFSWSITHRLSYILAFAVCMSIGPPHIYFLDRQ
jgi:hypothetical protein